MLRLTIIVLITLLLFISCEQQNTNEELFNTVWQTIYETYPDTTFESVDWVAIGDRYSEQLSTITNDDDLIELLNNMIFELNVSHSFIGNIAQIENKASPYMFKPGNPDIDIRILDNLVVVTKVTPNSIAERGNLLPGCVILKIDNQNVNSIISNAPIYPPYNERYKRFLQTEEVLRFLYGDTDSPVRINFLNNDGNQDEVKIIRTARMNKIILSPEIPPIHFECEWKVLQDDIGYLRFNAFQPENPITVLSAIDSLLTTKSLVIDLRGNNGGSLEAQRIIAERFIDKSMIGAFIESRNGIDTIYYNGNENAYTGPIAILVDEVSISGAELFPATLQSLGRAVVVGSRTPGAVMGGYLDFITDSLVLVHPTLIIKTNQGINLEGIGVKPDIVVTLDQKLLAEGRDSQLEAAIDYLK